MIEHDSLCPWAPETVHTYEVACQCRLIARIRADERERIVGELDGPARESEAMYAHACEQRDAARAEVAALRDEVARLEARWLARTPSYGALRDRREVLADLRAKVATRYIAESGASAANALDPAAFLIQKDAAVGTLKWVLALIEEAVR